MSDKEKETRIPLKKAVRTYTTHNGKLLHSMDYVNSSVESGGTTPIDIKLMTGKKETKKRR